MEINITKINLNPNAGGGGKPIELQEKSITITENGTREITPDEDFGGLSSVYVNTYVSEPSGMKDFSVLGYDEENNIGINQQIENDIAYSKTLYDAWDVNSTSLNFYNKNNLVYPPVVDTSNVTDFTNLFRDCKRVVYIPTYNTTNVKNYISAFNNCDFSHIDISTWDTSSAEKISSLFSNCEYLTDVDLSLNDWSSLQEVSYLFNNCKNVETVNVTGLVSNRIGNFTGLFTDDLILNNIIGLDTWDVSNVTDFYELFSECRMLSNDSLNQVEKWNVVNPKRFEGLFYNCKKLTSLDLSGWKTDTLTNVCAMFKYCNGLTTLDLSGWNLSNLTNTSSWFDSCSNLANLQFGYDIKYSFTLSSSTKLTVESILSVLNGLYDFTGNGETPTSSQSKLKLGSTNLAKLTNEQIAIGTAKGWTITA